MSLNITTLATRWGKIFGGMNQYDTFRGLTIYQRADTINALYPDADEQRIVVDNLYDRTVAVDESMNSIVSFYMTMAKNTLIQMCKDDNSAFSDESDTGVLNKLITDMVALGQTFQRHSPQLDGNTTNDATSVTTQQGAPTGNGIIVGTTINPRLAIAKPYAYPETIYITCKTDSYTSGVTAGQESFSVMGSLSTDYPNSDWPMGSGLNSIMSSLPSSLSTLVSNAYFDNWTDADANVPESWTLVNLSPGTTIFRDSDAYSTTYAVKLTGAILNAELKQKLTGLTGLKNYIIGLRIKRPGTVTTGSLTLSLRDANGTILKDAAGVDLSTVISLSGSAGNYILNKKVLSVPKNTATEVYASIRITTAMTGGESILFDNFELIPMVTTYPGGPDIGFIPGNIPWALNDTYKFGVTTSAVKSTFIKQLDRVYQISILDLDIPTASSPTQSDSLIS